jgi:hypothetical protein
MVQSSVNTMELVNMGGVDFSFQDQHTRERWKKR